MQNEPLLLRLLGFQRGYDCHLHFSMKSYQLQYVVMLDSQFAYFGV